MNKFKVLVMFFILSISISTGGQISGVRVHAFTKRTLVTSNKINLKQVIWKKYNLKSYGMELKKLGWQEHSYAGGYFREDLQRKRMGGDIYVEMGKSTVNNQEIETPLLVAIRSYRLNDYAPEYSENLENTLGIIIPDGAKEIAEFTKKIFLSDKDRGENYIFYNVNGTTVVVKEGIVSTDIYILNKPYMSKKQLEKQGIK